MSLDENSTQLPEHVQKNREMWDKTSNEYDERNEQALSGENALAWGEWRIPEAKLQVLGDVVGKDILEYGCGAARWSIALAQRGARPVALDISAQQLQHARHLMQNAGVSFPLIEANAENVPLPDAGFDIVFCDWGAMTFCDPYKTVPEVARLLRPGGLFAFMTATPILSMSMDRKVGNVGNVLLNNYFDMHRIEWPDEVEFQLPYGEWIRLFRRNKFIIEDLIETQPASDAKSSYVSAEETVLAHRFTRENLWKVRKEK